MAKSKKSSRPDISQKSFAFLLDSLFTTLLRCWLAQEQIMNPRLSKKERLQAAIRAQEQNAKRSELMKALDEMAGQGAISLGGIKTYYSYFGKKGKKKKWKNT